MQRRGQFSALRLVADGQPRRAATDSGMVQHPALLASNTANATSPQPPFPADAQQSMFVSDRWQRLKARGDFKPDLRRAILYAARTLGLFHVARALTTRGVRVLCYHAVWLGERDSPRDYMFIAASTFEQRLDLLRELGYPVVSLDEAVAALRGSRPLPACATVITIDDGWYSSFAHMAPLLKARGLPATLYCDTAHVAGQQPVYHVMARYIHIQAGAPPLDDDTRRQFERATDASLGADAQETATRAFAAALGVDIAPLIANRVFSYMTPDELRVLRVQAGIDVQLHSHTHSLHDLSPDAVRRELADNADALSAILDLPKNHFRHFCYPSGVTSRSVEETVGALGIASSTTTQPGFAFPGVGPQAIPRVLDGEKVSRIEFEAEMAGLMHIVRLVVSPVRRLRYAVKGATDLLRLRSRATSYSGR